MRWNTVTRIMSNQQICFYLRLHGDVNILVVCTVLSHSMVYYYFICQLYTAQTHQRKWLIWMVSSMQIDLSFIDLILHFHSNGFIKMSVDTSTTCTDTTADDTTNKHQTLYIANVKQNYLNLFVCKILNNFDFLNCWYSMTYVNLFATDSTLGTRITLVGVLLSKDLHQSGPGAQATVSQIYMNAAYMTDVSGAIFSKCVVKCDALHFLVTSPQI